MDHPEPTPHDRPTQRPVVLGLFAHPDDETLSAGGILATLARHCEVHVLTATRGEMGEHVAPGPERQNPDRQVLPGIREQEVRRACAALDLASHGFLDGGDHRFKDSGMQWEDDRRIRAIPDPNAPLDAFSLIDIENPAQAMAHHIVRLRPTLVLTEEPQGGYGHPDHIRCHEITMRAVELAAPTWRVPFVAFAVFDAERVREANTELSQAPVPERDEYAVSLRRPHPDEPMRSGVSESPDVVVDATAVRGRVTAAMKAHQTQVHMVAEYPGKTMAGWYALTNNDVKPIHIHAGLQLAAGWGQRAGLREFFRNLGVPLARPLDHSNPMSRGYQTFLNVFALLTGITAGIAGTFTHRAKPWGLAIALVAVFAGAVLNRSIGSRKTGLIYGVGVIGAVLALTVFRPGEDVIIVEDALGLFWLVGIFVFVFVGALASGAGTKKLRPGAVQEESGGTSGR